MMGSVVYRHLWLYAAPSYIAEGEMEVWVCAHVYFLCAGEWEEADAASRESNLLTTVIKHDTKKKLTSSEK